MSEANVTPISEQGKTVVAPNPKVVHKFAVRRLIKIVAVVCECGTTSHGPGVRKWRKCPRCGAQVIGSKDQRYREAYPWLDRNNDQLLHDRYQSPETQR